MSIIPKQYKDAVVSIGVRNFEHNVIWIGTGFFVSKKIDKSRSLLYLITNKHVLADNPTVVIRLLEKETGKMHMIDLAVTNQDKPIYMGHDIQRIDIAGILMNGGLIEKMGVNIAAFDVDELAVSSDEFIENGGAEGSIVYMLGYPLGLVDVESTAPICRMGCIARMEKTEIQREHYMLVDIQNFPGNSGSPIISRAELVKVGDSKAFNKCMLLGIVSGYIPYEEKLLNIQTKKVVETRSENSGLAVVYPVEYIRDIINSWTEQIKRNKIED